MSAPRCGGKPGEPGLDPRYDPDETGPRLEKCPECEISVPPLGRSAPMEMYQCDHRDVWPTHRSELWPGERRGDFGFPRCQGCPDCAPECDGGGRILAFEDDQGDGTVLRRYDNCPGCRRCKPCRYCEGTSDRQSHYDPSPSEQQWVHGSCPRCNGTGVEGK